MDKARAFLQNVDVVIHHSPCDDGHAAAAVFYHNNKNIIFIGMHPKDDLSAKLDIIRDKNIVFVDIAFSTEAMTRAASLAAKVVVLDHHITNKTALESLSLPNLISVFNMDVAGVFLAWQFVHGDSFPIPPALYYIGLKDVWKHEDNLSAVFFTTAFARPKTWEGWTPYIEQGRITDETIDRGQVICHYQKEVIKTMMEKVQTTTWRGYKMAIINVPFPWISDIGAQICEADPVNTIAVIWNKQATGPYAVSLRSHSTLGPNIEIIAKEFAGGGHAHAAGVRTVDPPYVVFSDTGKFE